MWKKPETHLTCPGVEIQKKCEMKTIPWIASLIYSTCNVLSLLVYSTCNEMFTCNVWNIGRTLCKDSHWEKLSGDYFWN